MMYSRGEEKLADGRETSGGAAIRNGNAVEEAKSRGMMEAE